MEEKPFRSQGIWNDKKTEWWLRRNYPKNSLPSGGPLRTFGEYVEAMHPGVTRMEITDGQLWQKIQAINRLVKEAEESRQAHKLNALKEAMRQIRNLIYPTAWDDRQVLARLKVDFQNVFHTYLQIMPQQDDEEKVASYWEFVDLHPVQSFGDYVEEEGLKYETRIEIRPSGRVRKILDIVNRYLNSAERARKYHDLDGLKTSLEQLRAFIASSATSPKSDSR